MVIIVYLFYALVIVDIYINVIAITGVVAVAFVVVGVAVVIVVGDAGYKVVVVVVEHIMLPVVSKGCGRRPSQLEHPL